MKITEKQIKILVTSINKLAKTRGLDYGFAIARSQSGYSIMQQPRDALCHTTRVVWGITASEAHQFLNGVACIIKSLPEVVCEKAM